MEDIKIQRDNYSVERERIRGESLITMIPEPTKIHTARSYSVTIFLKNIRRFAKVSNVTSSLQIGEDRVNFDLESFSNIYHESDVKLVLPLGSYNDIDSILEGQFELNIVSADINGKEHSQHMSGDISTQYCLPGYNCEPEPEPLEVNIIEGKFVNITATKGATSEELGAEYKTKIEVKNAYAYDVKITYTIQGEVVDGGDVRDREDYRFTTQSYYVGDLSTGQHTVKIVLDTFHRDGKYALGQGYYQIEGIEVEFSEGSDGVPQSTTTTEDEPDDRVHIVQDPTKHVIMNHLIYDGWIQSNDNCYDESSLKEDLLILNSRFQSPAIDEFTIDPHFYVKKYNWLSVDDYDNKGCEGGTLRYTSTDNDQMMKSARYVHEATLDLKYNWDDRSQYTVEHHHGYDQIMSITGLIRSPGTHDKGDIGNAKTLTKEGTDIILGGNLLYVTGGIKKYFRKPVFLADMDGESHFDQGIQHEISHLHAAGHDDSNENVMHPDLRYTTRYWNQAAKDKIGAHVTNFDEIQD